MFQITQLHIDMARNATDDFNLFHDKNRWHWLKKNPFNGPIALGFQLGLFIESQINTLDQSKFSQSAAFTTYELNFANPVRVNDFINLELKKSRFSETARGSIESQRLCLKANDKPAIMGFKRDSDFATIENQWFSHLPDNLSALKDRSFITNDTFLKRKWMIVGNVKNFLLSCHADQTNYVDEFANKVNFPKMYPLSLISSALLERAQALNHDLIANPQIYLSHKLCIDNQQLEQLRSNDCLQITVLQSPESSTEESTLYICGWVSESTPLLSAEVKLLSLHRLLALKEKS